jgi:hypothetical protein
MKKIIYIIAIAFISFTLLNSCNECPLENSPTTVCEVREATITVFNPSLRDPVPPDTVRFPVPEYSIHTFLFPIDKSNSGTLTNDSRFEDNEQLIMAQQPFPNPNGSGDLLAVIYDIFPFNSLMVGDLMVIRVRLNEDPTLNEADLRFYGYLERMPIDFLSENADEFCEDYISDIDEDYIEAFRQTASQYGRALPNAFIHSYDSDDVSVIDNQGNIVQGVDPPVVVVNELIDRAQNNAINVTVKPGQVYYYKARNGKEFAVVIADIKEGTFEPNKRRVTIMFTALR